MPVGTGRFLKLWDTMGLKVIGLDSSEAMLTLAKKKGAKAQLVIGDATNLGSGDLVANAKSFDHVVSIRFLDLIPEDAMQAAMREFCRVAKQTVTLTIRLGKRYVPKSNTATHDEVRFRALVKRLGFVVDEEQTIFKAGWHVMCLKRK